MKIVINENSHNDEPEIIINCKRADEEILGILAHLRAFDKKLTGTKDGKTHILEAAEILYFDTADKRTFIYTEKDVFETPLKLYEIEERLSGNDFFRSSKSAIINFNKIKSLRPDFGGKLELTMANGERVSVSRQYAVGLKKRLGL